MKYFNSYQAAKIMNVNVSTIKRWTDTKKLDCIQTPGGHRKFTLYQINEYYRKSKKSKPINIYKISDSLNDLLCKHIENLDYKELNIYFFDILLEGDSERITSILESLYLKSESIYKIYDNLVCPCLNKIGNLWEKNQISIADEHLASNTIIKSINNLNSLIIKESNILSKLVLLFGIKNNNHSIPLQMAEQILVSHGHKVINCSSDTPIFSLKSMIENHKPNMILVSMTYIADKKESISEILQLKKINKNNKATLYIAGNSNNFFKNKNFDGIKIINTMKDLNIVSKEK